MNRRRTLPRAAAALAVCAALVLPACTASSAGPGNTYKFSSFTTLGKVTPAAQRKKAQDFSGEQLSGGTVSLGQFKGHVTVVNFFASWCPPCQVETPQLALMAKRVKSQGVDFLGIDTKDAKPNARTFLQHSGVTYPVLYDQQGRTALTLGNVPGSLPFTVLVDKTGKVAAVYEGLVSVKDLQPAVNRLRAER